MYHLQSGQMQPGTFKETSAGVYGGARRLQGAGKPLVIRGGIATMRVSAVNSELRHFNSLQVRNSLLLEPLSLI